MFSTVAADIADAAPVFEDVQAVRKVRVSKPSPQAPPSRYVNNRFITPETDTSFLRVPAQDMIVLTAALLIENEGQARFIEDIVAELVTNVKDESKTEALAIELEADLLQDVDEAAGSSRVPAKNTRRNTQSCCSISELMVDGVPTTIVVRYVDYTTSSNIRRSNFRNQVTIRHGEEKGPTIKLFKNGSIQGAGWKHSEQFVRFVNEVCGKMALPPLDTASIKYSLVNGSARVRNVPAQGFSLNIISEQLLSQGHQVSWNPSTGNNGMKLIIPDPEGNRSAMVFSKGYLKLFAKSEEQLARIIQTASIILEPSMTAEHSKSLEEPEPKRARVGRL